MPCSLYQASGSYCSCLSSVRPVILAINWLFRHNLLKFCNILKELQDCFPVITVGDWIENEQHYIEAARHSQKPKGLMFQSSRAAGDFSYSVITGIHSNFMALDQMDIFSLFLDKAHHQNLLGQKGEEIAP